MPPTRSISAPLANGRVGSLPVAARAESAVVPVDVPDVPVPGVVPGLVPGLVPGAGEFVGAGTATAEVVTV
jgi:hypothetical protein